MADAKDISVNAPMAGDFFSASDPMALFADWFATAQDREINDPNAMALATVDGNGFPNVRMVLLKDVSAGGFVFYTNRDSAKGRELLTTKTAALLFHWKALRRQVRIRGVVALVAEDEADAYFSSRPHGSRIGAWASSQSRPLANRKVLEDEFAALALRYPIVVPRPKIWSGFRVMPTAIEFWHDRPFRLHDRVLFTRPGTDDVWSKSRLYP
jgi:pyridoxamine 5'-phosphate oxidase